jgi:Mobilization protein NikA
MTRTTISFTREGMQVIQEAAKRQGISVSQFVREAALMRATMAADDNPYPMRMLAAQLRAIGDQGYALAEKALKVAEEETDRKRWAGIDRRQASVVRTVRTNGAYC